MKFQDFSKFYDLENYLINEVSQKFHRKGHIDVFDFFCIIIWKSNRSKSRIAKLVQKGDSNMNKTIKELTSSLFKEETKRGKLKILVKDYKFRLPIASAILTILYPKDFTVYDDRVCHTLSEFKNLKNKTNFETLWNGYEKFLIAVKNYGNIDNTLREKDKMLWGRSFYNNLKNDIEGNFLK
jgi:hypothetical protein